MSARQLLLRAEGSWWLTRVSFVWIPMMVPAGWFAARGVDDLGGLALLFVAVGCAGGVVASLNDILDEEKDRVTAPRLPMPSGVVSLPQATATAGVLGCAFVALLALASDSPQAFLGALLLAVAGAVLVSLYSPSKRYALPPLLIAAALYGSVPLIAWIAAGGGDGPIVAAVAYGMCFGLGTNTYTALQDVDSDPDVGNRSIAVLLGSERAVLLAGAFDLAGHACVLAAAADVDRLEVGIPAVALSALVVVGSHLHARRSGRAARARGRDARLTDTRSLTLTRLVTQVALMAVFSVPAALAIAGVVGGVLIALISGYRRRVVAGGLRQALYDSP